MRPGCSTSLALIMVALLLWSPEPAQASDERQAPKVGSSTPAPPVFPGNAAFEAARLAQPAADPVGNGVAIGAAAGAGTGLALMAWAYAQCDDTCDAPEPAPMYLMAGGVGAAIGGVVGWILDASRKSTSPRVSVGGAVAPRRSQVRVTVRW